MNASFVRRGVTSRALVGRVVFWLMVGSCVATGGAEAPAAESPTAASPTVDSPNLRVIPVQFPEDAHELAEQAVRLHRAGRTREAIPLAKRALALRVQSEGPRSPNAATGLNNLGMLYEALGDYAAARPYLEQALAIRREILGETHPNTAQSINNVGYVLLAMGDYAAARPYYERALALRRSVLGDMHPDTAASFNNLAYLLEAMGDYAAARPYYEKSLAIQRQTLGEKHADTASAYNNLGNLLQELSDYEGARRYFDRALALRREILGEKHPDTAQSYNNLGYLLQAIGDYAAAGANFEQALSIWRENLGNKHSSTALALANLGNLNQSLGDYEAARSYYQQALAIYREALGENHPDTARAYGNLATVEAATGHWDLAGELRDSARRVVRRHVARVLPGMSEQEQLTFLEKKDETSFYKGLTLGLNGRDQPRIASLSAAWLLNAKAVAQESLADRALLGRDSKDPALAETVDNLKTTRRQLAALALTAPKKGQEQERSQAIERLERQEQELSRRLSFGAGRQDRADPWIDIDSVRAALPADGALVDIACFKPYNYLAKGKEEQWQPPRYVAWITPPSGKGDVTIVDLGDAAKIDAAVDAVRGGVAEAIGVGGEGLIVQQGEAEAEKALRGPLESLSKLVLQPLVGALGGATKLALSPDAALWLVPWSALPLADGRYAIEVYEIDYGVSGRDLAPRKTTRVGVGAPVMMANPNYDLAPRETAQATQAVLRGVKLPDDIELRKLSSENSALPKVQPLPGTAKEAKAIEPKLAAYAGAAPTLYEGQYALEGVFKALQRPKVVVLSTHGFFFPDQEPKSEEQASQSAIDTRSAALTANGKQIENPLLRCGLLLAGCNARAASAGVDDGILTGMEIVGTDLRGTDLVVLSACETGLGKVRNGEGVAGLRQAFQLAGANAVVATLWQVPDSPSAKLMSDFFTNLAAGQGKAEALRNAQLTMIEGRREKQGAAHPFFWAAYTLTGH